MPLDHRFAPPSPLPKGVPGAAPGARALYAVATSLDESSEPAVILHTLLRRCAEATGAGTALLVTHGAPGGTLLEASWGPAAPSLPPGEPAATAAGPGGHLRTTEGIAQPLFHGGRSLGTLLLTDPIDGSFTPAARRMAEALAHPAAAVAAVALRLATAEEQARRFEGEATLRAEVVAAVDHDLRTPLTTILGALQTMARPELAPADPDLAALLVSALGQAQRMRRLLGDLLIGASPAARRSEVLLPGGLATLIEEAADAGMGSGYPVEVQVPADLPPAVCDAPALRRALAGILRQLRRRGVGARVVVAARGEDCLITVATDGDGPMPVPDLSARLVSAIGGRIEEADATEGAAAVRLVLPGALAPGSRPAASA
jgi:K+-sensing histidine kinase KdpD